MRVFDYRGNDRAGDWFSGTYRLLSRLGVYSFALVRREDFCTVTRLGQLPPEGGTLTTRVHPSTGEWLNRNYSTG